MRKIVSPAKGTLLLAHPFLLDPNFHRTVVLLAEHNEEGTVGFVINRPLEITLSGAVEELSAFDIPLFFGGPVQQGTLHFFHRVPKQIKNSIDVIPGVSWGGDFEALKPLVEEKKVQLEDFQFFLGCSGWGPGQLEDELQRKSWFVTSATAKDMFQKKENNLWKDILQELGDKYAILANAPEDPSFN